MAALALPLALTFAIASGLPPSAGLWTAIVAGLVAALAGGSSYQVTGPTGAFIPVVASVAAAHGVGGLAAATMMSGLILLAMGLLRLGKLVRLMPVGVVLGFTNGIAAVIAIAQLPDALGFPKVKLSAHAWEKLVEVAKLAGTLGSAKVALATTLSVAFLFAWKAAGDRGGKVCKKLPAPLALFLGATAASALGWVDLPTVEGKFGAVPGGWPELAIPNFAGWVDLLGPAFSIALLGAVESLLSAKVADSKAGGRHDPDQELVGQGLANVAAPFFGGFAATGAIARTATNVSVGGRTPLSAAVHAVALGAIALVAAPAAGKAPLCALSAIALATAWNMGEWSEFKRMMLFSAGYKTVLTGTFLATVFLELAPAIGIGLGLALAVFARQAIRMSQASKMPKEALAQAAASPEAKAAALSGAAAAFELKGMLFFGTASKVEELADELPWPGTRCVILECSGLAEMDTTGLEALRSLERDLASRGARMMVCGLRGRPKALVAKDEEALGPDSEFDGLAEALAACAALPTLAEHLAYAP